MQIAHAAGDELPVLGAEIDDDDQLVGRGGCVRHKSSFVLRGRSAAAPSLVWRYLTRNAAKFRRGNAHALHQGIVQTS